MSKFNDKMAVCPGRISGVVAVALLQTALIVFVLMNYNLVRRRGLGLLTNMPITTKMFSKDSINQQALQNNNSFTQHGNVPQQKECPTIDKETGGTGRTDYIEGLTGRIYNLSKTRSYSGNLTLPTSLVDRSQTCRFSNARAGRTCERWIVVTTIFPARNILRKISSLPGWCMVVVSDKKGPVSMDVKNIDFLDVLQQEGCTYQICRLIPWNHFGRKNIGFMYAIEHGAKLIYDTDDDNEPLHSVLPEFDNVNYARLVRVQSHVWNPYTEFGPDKDIWPRGIPLNHIIDNATKITVMGKKFAQDKVAVVQYLAQHDPDVDAIYRLTRKLPYEFNTKTRRLVVPQRVMSPYNAQATLHAKEAFWGMLIPITVHGRVSDIWRSYFTQRLLWDIGKRLAFHSPEVIQYRNPHNYMADFDSEMDLYYKADNLVKFLLVWVPDDSSATLEQRLVALNIQLYEYGFIEKADIAMTVAWIRDLRCLGYVFPKVMTRYNKQ